MEEKDVERQLKEDAEKLEMKDFSERWEIIKDKITPLEDGLHDQVLCEQKVVASTCGSYSESRGVNKKMLFFSGLIVLLAAVCLAIVLPIMLRKQPQERYLGLADLERKDVSQSEFVESIERSNLRLINLSSYELDTYYLLITEDEMVLGGGVDLLDLETGSFNKLMFYSSNVKSEFEISGDYQVCTISNVKIKYATKFEADIYTTIAIADSGKVIYELNCMTGDENVTPVFERLFGNA